MECLRWDASEYGDLKSMFDKNKKEDYEPKSQSPISTDEYKREIVWKNVFLFLILHSCGFWGIWQVLTLQAKWQTVLWTFTVGWMSSEAIMVGNHRYFCHKCFKGNNWFKVLVMVFQTVAGQNCIYIWSRDHRMHHKYSDTDADPHNSTRGFFFCHMGWLLLRKHPQVKLKGKHIDMSDLEAEPIVMFQKRYYYVLYMMLALGMPVAVPYYAWGESFKNAFLIAYFTRYMMTLHGTWTVNSFAHLYGYRPYTKDIPPVESEFVAFITSGEGWHNYHHTFPWDYRAGEFGKKWNFSAKIVDWFASFGWVYDLKCATPEMVKYRVGKRGDGTHSLTHEQVFIPDAPSKKISCQGKIELTKSAFGDDDSEDIYGEKITKEGFTILRRARA